MYVAESEKFAHITYFFNGGYAHRFCDEEWVKIPSPEVDNYAQKPEMSSSEITDKVIDGIKSKKYDFIACNFASPDMVGHSGNYSAATKAVSAVDKELGRIEKAVLENGARCVITADHGNIETMINPETNEVDTEHSTNPVPLFLIGVDDSLLRKTGKLADVAPTILKIMGLKQPKEMSGKSLI
jgi:2,3-bisphosphoglycerate-independent phosphoglycerate mutase